MDLPQSRTLGEIQKTRVFLVGDTFRTIADALALLDSVPNGLKATRFFGNKKCAWFPKIAVEKDGALVPPTDDINWRNTLSSDCTELLQRWTASGSPPDDDDRFCDMSVVRAVFVKLTVKQEYTFLGIFKKLRETDLYGADVFRRIAYDLSIDEWIEAKSNA